jgi:hypothetical protein
VRVVRFRVAVMLLAAACAALPPRVAGAQTYPVRAKFEVDGKESKRKFRVLLYADGAPIEPTVSDDGKFYVPALDIEWVDVRLISGKHDLLYQGVYLKKLRGSLTFGVKENLSGEEAACEPGKKLVAAYYLEFHPDDAAGTVLSIKVCE